MTTVLIDLNVPGVDGPEPAVGNLLCAPTKRYEAADESIILPDSMVVHLVDGKAEVDLDANGPEWAWKIIEATQVRTERYVSVPESATPIKYSALVEVDPASLQPGAQPEAAWWIALEDVVAGTVDPEEIAAAVDAYMLANPIDAVTQAELTAAINAVELEPGPAGDDGNDGASAYEVAVANGYVGSQSQWLASLVGPKGDKGDKGDPGDDATGGGGSGLLNEVVVYGDSLVSNDNLFGNTRYFHEILEDELGVPVAGMGYGGATSVQVAGTAGVYRCDVTVENNTIPASGSVTCTVTNPEALKAEYDLNDGWLGGVYGHWSGASFSGNTRVFVRETPGEAVTVLPGTTWQPARAKGQEGKVALFIAGGNDGPSGVTEAERIAAYKAMGRRWGHRIVPVTSIHVDLQMATEANNGATEDAVAAEFDGRCLNLREFMQSEEALVWAGVTPTTADQEALNAGSIPPSLVYPDGTGGGFDRHFTEAGHIAFARKWKSIAIGLGLLDVAVTPPPADTTNPTAPIIGTPTKTHNSVSLPFSGATDDTAVTGYHLRQDGALVAGTFTASPKVVTGLLPNTEYDFEIRARDAAGNVSPWSNLVTVTTNAPPADTTAPTQPGVVVISDITETGAALTWPPSTDAVGVTGYRIVGVGEDRTPTSPAYTFTGLAADTPYSGTVYALDAAGNESVGRTFSFTTAGTSTEPTEPTWLSTVTRRYRAQDATLSTDGSATEYVSGVPNLGTGTGILRSTTGTNPNDQPVTTTVNGDLHLLPRSPLAPGGTTPVADPTLKSFAWVGTAAPTGDWTPVMRITIGSDQFAGYVLVKPDGTGGVRGDDGGESPMAGIPIGEPVVIAATLVNGFLRVNVNGVWQAVGDSFWKAGTLTTTLQIRPSMPQPGTNQTFAEGIADSAVWTEAQVDELVAYLMDVHNVA